MFASVQFTQFIVHKPADYNFFVIFLVNLNILRTIIVDTNTQHINIHCLTVVNIQREINMKCLIFEAN